MKHVDISGNKFGRLTAVKVDHSDGHSNFWLCKCDCGNLIVVRLQHLRQGMTKSCGCLQREMRKTRGERSKIGERTRTHGLSSHPLHNVWNGMKSRCYNHNHKYFHRYGGRGISICNEWKDNFLDFYNWCVNHGYKDGMTVDRIDNDGDYKPSNCRLVDYVKQANNKSNTIYVIHNGKSYTISDICKITGLKRRTVYERVKKGLSFEEITNTELKKNQFC